MFWQKRTWLTSGRKDQVSHFIAHVTVSEFIMEGAFLKSLPVKSLGETCPRTAGLVVFHLQNMYPSCTNTSCNWFWSLIALSMESALSSSHHIEWTLIGLSKYWIVLHVRVIYGVCFNIYYIVAANSDMATSNVSFIIQNQSMNLVCPFTRQV